MEFLAALTTQFWALASHPSVPLYVAALGVILLAIGSAYVGMVFGLHKPRPHSDPIVVGASDFMADWLEEAEKIGHFGSFMWDFEYPELSYWSDALFFLFDLDKQGRPPTPEAFLGFVIPEDRAKADEAWKKLIIHAGTFSFNARFKTKSGRFTHFKVQGKTVIDANMKAKKIQGVVQDITKEMEIDRAKSEFVSLASHQLKTPLTSMRWLSEAMLRGSAGELQPEQHKYVSNIYDAAKRMVEMVNDLLNVSRIETDTLVIRPEVLDIAQIAQSVIDEQRHVADAKRLVLTAVYAPSLPQLNADKQLLRMVLQNLLSNAIKYTPEKGSVTCDISLAAAAREMIFLRVQDTGMGIPKDEQSRVFEKLHRASNAEALVPDGTGLGLYLVKTIIDKVGGGITFESTEGKGTTFFVSIPVAWKASGSKPLAAGTTA